VIHPNRSISPDQGRGLLQRFRDLNLGPCGIDVGDQARVTVAGCLSLDHPVEGGVRYSLLEPSGAQRVLGIQWSDGRLEIGLSAEVEPGASSSFGVTLGRDGLGRIAAPELGARLDLERPDAKEVEHFLRRIVRAAYARAS